MKKRLLSILLTACMVLTLLPTVALAVDNSPTKSIADSSLYFKDDGDGTKYSTNNTDWISYTGSFTITGSSTSDTATTNTVVVLSGTHNITLSNCSIGAATATGNFLNGAISPFDIQANAVVNLTLSGNNKLYSANYRNAGLHVLATAKLTIFGSGSLDARCQKNSVSYYGQGAGIGGNYGYGCGAITINGGTVSAYSFYGAGIGGGYKANLGFGNVTVSGGTVYAQSDWGCGIGYGKDSIGTYGTVAITGGSVNTYLSQAGNTNPNIGGTVKNGSETTVELYTLTITNGSGVSVPNTAVTSLTTMSDLGYTYGTTDMQTDANGKLYVYLPSGKMQALVTIGSTTYAGTIASNAATLAPAYTATVTVYKDGSPWSDSEKSFALYQSGVKYGLTVSGFTATASVLSGAYYIYDGTTNTGVVISVSSDGSNAASMNYYTLTLSAGTGTASPTGGGVYLPGKSVSVDTTVNTGYQWSKWASSNTGLLSDQSTKSVSITMPAAAITLTATAAPIQYTITYTLNGGAVTTANPTSYTVESTKIDLNAPTRSGYSFLGWTGSNGATAQTNVSIPTGSTDNKSYTANWKADKPASAPDASIVTAKTDTSLTITTQEGYEYSVGGSWYSGASDSYTFNGLEPGKAYNLVCRKAAVTTGDTFSASDPSDPQSVTTKIASASISVPTAPVIGTGSDKPTSDSITVSTAAGNEYYISESATADWSGAPNGYFKASISGTHTFDSLSPATQYYIHVRVSETENAMPSVSAYVAQYTPPTTPAAGTGYSINYAEEIITVSSGYEVNTNADFTGTAVENNAPLTPGTTYYVRVKAISGGAPASEAVSFTIPARPATPTAITADKTKNSITITTVAGQEYKIGSGEWQDSGSFTVLSDTEYTVYARVKAVSSGGVSFASEAYSTTIRTKSDGSVGFTLPTISVTPTYSPGKTLGDISLLTGWAWSDSETVPTVTNSGYSAVYTPADTDTVDYSDIEGYGIDGDGKVIITRTVSLTVNRAAPTAADFTYIAPASLDFSDTAKTATVTAKAGISGIGAVTVRYFLDGVEATPKAAGTYTVNIDLTQGGNYAAASAVTDDAWKFTIAKVAQASLSIKNKPASITYGDTFTLAAEGGSGEGTVTWSVTSGSSADVNTDTGAVTITGIGETTITATKAADGNYTNAVTDTYTFTPAKRLITVDTPSATGGWTKIYNGDTDYDKSSIIVGGITNKVGSDTVSVSVQSAAYYTADVGSGDKTLTITYAIDGADSGNYSAPDNTVISTASITAATPTITLKNKIETYTDKNIEIDAATVKGVTGGTTPDGVITYTYYTKDTCTDADKTSTDKSGAEAIGGAPKATGTYYVKANIAASGNYAAATSEAVTLTIYYPSSGEANASTPVIVDGKTVDMGTTEVKDGTTTVTVDQNKMSEQLKNAMESVVIPITSKTDTASAQLVVQNVEDMAERSMTLTVKVNDISYEIPSGSVDTADILKNLGASDSSKVPLNVTISKLSDDAVTIKDGTLMVAPIAFTITATYNGKSVDIGRFESYVQRVIEIPSGVDPKTITTAVVMEENGTERHVPTEVYSKGGKWYAKVNSMTNSTYALIQNSASFTDTTGKWYAAVAAEMASRKILSGIGENMFAGDLSITRAEFAAILVRALGLSADGTSIFSDVSASAWYSGTVATAAQYGLVTGKGDNRFAPDAYITRQEAMTMLQRAAKLTGYTGTVGSLEGFTDAASVGTWAQSAAKWNVGSGLIVGYSGLLRPNDSISRAESATVILRLLQKTGLVDVRTEA
ncbi:MAG: S-layer homology domain-containing protein [Oscillospiraceae bacterium]|nr:S-layer homology domain-containing protein [Oscillospiraceae bacterium]